MTRAGLALLLLLGTSPALAEPLTSEPSKPERGQPDPSYFTGPYQRIGRDGQGGLVDDLIRLDPQPGGGGGILLRRCAGDPAPILLKQVAFEVPNILAGGGLFCEWFNDSGNYPILTCQADDQSRLTLWPAPDQTCPAP